MKPLRQTPAPQAWALCSAAFLLPVLTACSTVQTSPGDTLAQARLESGLTVIEQAARTFAQDLKASAAAPASAPAAAKAWRSGRATLDLHCNVYLDGLGMANQAAGYERKQTSLIGGFVSALMGLTGSTTKQVAGVASAFSFAGSSMDTFTSSYLFSDAAKSVTKIVRSSQNAYLGSLALDTQSLEYPDMVSALMGYEALCRPAQIRALIDEAVNRGQVVADFSAPQVSDGETTALLASLSTALGRSVNEVQAINLYAWYASPANRSAGAKTELNDPIPALKKDGKSDSDLQRLLSQAFLPLALGSSRVAARWNPAVKQVLAVAPAPAAAASAVPAPAPAFIMGALPAPPEGTAARTLRLPTLTVR